MKYLGNVLEGFGKISFPPKATYKYFCCCCFCFSRQKTNVAVTLQLQQAFAKKHNSTVIFTGCTPRWGRFTITRLYSSAMRSLAKCGFSGP